MLHRSRLSVSTISVSLMFHELEMALPQDVALQKSSGPKSYAWRHPGGAGVMVTMEARGVPSEAGGPKGLTGLLEQTLGLGEAAGEPSPLICAGDTTVYEWSAEKEDGSVWIAVAEHRNGKDKPSDYAFVMMGGPEGSTYAADGAACRQLRASLSVRSLSDSALKGHPGSCGDARGSTF